MRQKAEEEAVEYDKRNTRKTDVTSRTEGVEAVQHVPFNLPANASCSRKQLSQTQHASWDTPNPCSR